MTMQSWGAPLPLTAKKILVTGGTGSLGKAFVKRAESGEFGNPRLIRIFSRDEFKQDAMRREFPVLDYQLGDMRDYDAVKMAISDMDIVVNAAALKQVPSCEEFPWQAIATNCYGTYNLIQAVKESRKPPKTVLTVSTDKACKPTTVMGMTKALQERMIVAANGDGRTDTRFIGVRYGNVLESRGSVIPLFKEQIAKGGPLTITVPEMTRFLLTLDQAVDTMMAALEHAAPGEIYVPTAPSATVINIALVMCQGRDIPVKITGIRPAEKLHEIMYSMEESHHTVARGQYYAIRPPGEHRPEWSDLGIAGTEYSSKYATIDVSALAALLQKHGVIQ
jgi:FlaA1/EpsC-like NDP-sugar epimerase